MAAVGIERKTNGKSTMERRYIMSGRAANAEKLGKAVRSHWQVENLLYWVLDVVFEDDASRARTKNAAGNRSSMRRLSRNLIEVTPI